MKKLYLYYPVKPDVVNQYFGNKAQMYTDLGMLGHNGWDFRAMHGTPIYAAHDGTAYYENDDKGGEGVVLRTNEVFDSDTTPGYSQVYYKTIYWHMCPSAKDPNHRSPIYTAVGYRPDQTGISNVGVQVRCGDLLGYADNTGMSTGDHLHFGLKPQLPGEANGTWFNVGQNNGYFGAIDPTSFWNGKYAEDVRGLQNAVNGIQAVVDSKPNLPADMWMAIIQLLLKVASWLDK